MKPRLKVAFVDFSKRTFVLARFFIHELLSERYDLEISDRPHVLFYSCFGQQHLKYRCRRVFYTGENRRPDWNVCDYALTFDHLDHPDHYRLPNYARGSYGDMSELVKGEVDVGRILAEKTRFCNFIYSNPNCPERNEFFDLLSRYKRVDAPGQVRNNMPLAIEPRYGAWVESKLAFLRPYKFTIAFENASYPGYTTEKILQPMQANSLPIYWGNPLVHLDFNPRSFLSFYDHPSLEELAERVIAVDQDDDLYAEYLRQPWLNGNQTPPAYERASIQQFLVRAIETPRRPVALNPWRQLARLAHRYWAGKAA